MTYSVDRNYWENILFLMKTLPKKLRKTPIHTVSFELRFQSDIPRDAIFGVFFNLVRDKFSDFSNLPIMELPDTVRQNDPSLKYQPYYRLSTKEYILQIGPNVILVHPVSYISWLSLFEEVKYLLKKIWDIQAVTKIDRVGLRYVNIFPASDISSKIKLEIQFLGENHYSQNLHFRTMISKGIFNTIVLIANNASFILEDKALSGSLIDIDTFFEQSQLDIDSLLESVDESHKLIKTMFFSILHDKFITELEPEFENE